MDILGLNMITYSNRPFMASPACVFRTSTECRSRAASRRWELVDLATEHPQWVTSLVLMLGPVHQTAWPRIWWKPENREAWQTNSLHLKKMFFGICWRMFWCFLMMFFSFWKWSHSIWGQFGFGVKLYCPISSSFSKQDVHPNGGPTQIDRSVMVVKLILWGRS